MFVTSTWKAKPQTVRATKDERSSKNQMTAKAVLVTQIFSLEHAHT